jgi:hypothetical protein
MHGFGHAFGVRHHAQHISGSIKHASDVAGRTIYVFGVTEGNTAFALKPIKRLSISEIIAVMMRNGNSDLLTGGIAAGKNRAIIFDR